MEIKGKRKLRLKKMIIHKGKDEVGNKGKFYQIVYMTVYSPFG